jgi:hypothetical protein
MIGEEAMVRNMLKIAAEFPERVGKALSAEAKIEVREMKRRTPVDTTPNAPHPGQLRDSIHDHPPERLFRRISVLITTGPEAPYDIYVHENPDAIHSVGQWQFMSSVINESRSFMGERVARRVKF